MSLEAVLTITVVVAVLLALVLEVYAPDIIVFSGLGLLLLTGVLTPAEALSGFSNTGMLTVALLFIVAFAAQSSGVLEWIADRIMGRSRGGRRSLARMMVPVIALSAFINNTPLVAMFTPTIRDWALRRKLAPSKFLIPLTYAVSFGGICTLIGTSTNLVVNGLLQRFSGHSLTMFELARVGVPCALAGTLFILVCGYRILPENPDMAEEYERSGRDYLMEMRVADSSPLAGKTIENAGLRHLDSIFLAEIVRDGQIIAPVKPTDLLCGGDHLFFSGIAAGMVRLHNIPGLVPAHDLDFCSSIRNSGSGRVVEAVVSRASPMLGKSIKEGDFRSRYDAAVLAVHRHGERFNASLGKLELKHGDTLLLLAGDDFLKRYRHSRDFYMMSKVTDLPTFNRRKTVISIASLLAIILLAAFEIMDIFNASILAVSTLIFTRCITVVEARRSLELNVLIVIASSFGISRALEKSGVAALLAGHIISGLQDFGPVGLLAGIYLVTTLLTEVITNNAAAALIFPIAMATAVKTGLSPVPFAVAVAVAASASFATTIGYQTNMMVSGPGGYRFADFLRVGIPLKLVFMLVSVTVIPVYWKL